MRTDHIFFVIFLTVSLFVMIINHLQNDDIFFRIEGQIMNRKKSYGSRKLISIEHKNPNHLNHVWGKKKKKRQSFLSSVNIPTFSCNVPLLHLYWLYEYCTSTDSGCRVSPFFLPFAELRWCQFCAAFWWLLGWTEL